MTRFLFNNDEELFLKFRTIWVISGHEVWEFSQATKKKWAIKIFQIAKYQEILLENKDSLKQWKQRLDFCQCNCLMISNRQYSQTIAKLCKSKFLINQFHTYILLNYGEYWTTIIFCQYVGFQYTKLPRNISNLCEEENDISKFWDQMKV